MAESELVHRSSSGGGGGAGYPAARPDFPQSEDEFGDDPRVSYYKVDEKWILEDDDGSEWEWNGALKRWMPSVCPCSALVALFAEKENRVACCFCSVAAAPVFLSFAFIPFSAPLPSLSSYTCMLSHPP